MFNLGYSRINSPRKGKNSLWDHRPSKAGQASSSKKTTKEYSHYLYDTLRILVVGRSGAGKTTLIRLLVGKGGPQKLGTNAVAGTQNIEKEWRVLETEGLPQLVFHDSNGMGVSGRKSLAEVKNFIDSRNNDSSHVPDRIHLIWYIISAADNRFADDGGLMRVVLESNIPVLLIMTYNDLGQEICKLHVTDHNLDLLLESNTDENKRSEIKRQMVRIGNKVKIDDKSGEMTGEPDIRGLHNVSKQTEMLLHKTAKFTWIAAQEVDISTKIHATTTLIMQMTKAALIGKVFTLSMDSIVLVAVFRTLEKNICKLWRVPKELRKALSTMYFHNEGYRLLLLEARHDIEKLIGVLSALIVLVVCTATSLPVPVQPLLVSIAGALRLGSKPSGNGPNERLLHKTTILVITYALNLLLAILFMKAQQWIKMKAGQGRDQHQLLHEPWDPALTQDHYMRLCEKFLKNMETGFPVLEQGGCSSGGGGTAISSKWDVMFRSDNVALLVDNFAVKQYKMYLRNAHGNTRPTNNQVNPEPSPDPGHANDTNKTQKDQECLIYKLDDLEDSNMEDDEIKGIHNSFKVALSDIQASIYNYSIHEYELKSLTSWLE